jgi:Zn-dependent protease with chaperone function
MTWHDIIQLHVAGAQGVCAGRQNGLVGLRWTDVPDTLRALAERMRVSLDSSFPVELSPSWRGARAIAAVVGGRGNRIRLGGALAGTLSPEALEGVMAHELAHLKCRHWELLLLGCILAALGGVALGLALDLSTGLRMAFGGLVPIVSAAGLSWASECWVSGE